MVPLAHIGTRRVDGRRFGVVVLPVQRPEGGWCVDAASRVGRAAAPPVVAGLGGPARRPPPLGRPARWAAARLTVSSTSRGAVRGEGLL